MWTAGLAVEILGVRIGLRCDDAALLREAIAYLPPGWKCTAPAVVDSLLSIRAGGLGTSRGMRRYYLLYDGASRVVRTLERDELFDRLASTVRLAVAEQAVERLFLHAGVVEWRGSAILLPGATFTGKTSLVVELIRAGATYYSDDCAVLDERGLVYPYPEPLGIRSQHSALQTRHAAEDMNVRVGREPVPVGLIAFTHYARGATWRPRRLAPGHAMLALVQYTSAVRRRPMSAMETLRRMSERATVLAGVRGDAAETAKLLLHHGTTAPSLPSASLGARAVPRPATR